MKIWCAVNLLRQGAKIDQKKKINVHDLHIAVKALHININSYFMLVQIMQSAWKLIELDMAGTGVGSMSGQALKYLQNLKVLNLCNNPSLRKATISIVNGLQGIALEELYMNNTGIGDNI